MSVVPHRFLVRMMYACPYVAAMPQEGKNRLISLTDSARLNPFSDYDNLPEFAAVSVGWNETGLGLTLEVKGKKKAPVGDLDRPRQSDGITLWIDTRGDRTGHRATRTCHQFIFLPTGGGEDKEEPAFVQMKINRALIDAPLVSSTDIPLRSEITKGGYRLEAFLSGNVLSGFNPDEFPRLGICYSVRDDELGEQTLFSDNDFPFWEDPSLWSSLELVK